jgi:hypothetical protein
MMKPNIPASTFASPVPTTAAGTPPTLMGILVILQSTSKLNAKKIDTWVGTKKVAKSKQVPEIYQTNTYTTHPNHKQSLETTTEVSTILSKENISAQYYKDTDYGLHNRHACDLIVFHNP